MFVWHVQIGRELKKCDASLHGGAGGHYLTPNPRNSNGDTVPVGQLDWGGRLLRATGVPKGSLRMVGNHSCRAYGRRGA